MRPGAHQPTARGRRWEWGQGDHSTQTSAPQAPRQARSLRPNQVYPRGAALPRWQGPRRPPDHASAPHTCPPACTTLRRKASRPWDWGRPLPTGRPPDSRRLAHPQGRLPPALASPRPVTSSKPILSRHQGPTSRSSPHEYLPNLGFQDPGGRPQKSHCRLEGPGTPTPTAGNGTSLPALLFGLRLVCDARVVFMTVTQATSAAA